MDKLEQERLDKQMKNDNGNRMVAWNAHMANDVGVIWCMVTENEAGYQPMTGRDPLAAPWYLAYLENHTDQDGKVDYTALWKNAEDTADSYNWDRGYTREEVTKRVASSMRRGRIG